MTVAEIVDETVEYYKTHPRAVRDDGSCQYFEPGTGCMCAVGRCLEDPGLPMSVGTNAQAIELAWDLDAARLDDLLKPRYRGHPEAFWGELQVLHDLAQNWRRDETAPGGMILSATGKKEASLIKKKFSRN